MSDSKKKSLIKSISWQLVHMSLVGAVALLVTHKWEVAGILAISELVWETAAYYLHERAWARWGKKVK